MECVREVSIFYYYFGGCYVGFVLFYLEIEEEVVVGVGFYILEINDLGDYRM